MDLGLDYGLDYLRVLLALGFVSSWFCPPKIGMAGRGHWGKPPGLQVSGFYKTHIRESAIGRSRSLAHICPAKESVPRPHLCPRCLGAAASAQHKRGAAAPVLCTLHTALHPHALCSSCHRVPPVNDPAADGTCSSRLHAAALPCDWLHPI